MKRDRELEACSQAHYADPAYYRDTYRERDEDVAYYLALALRLKRRGARVLEYGVGNGRIALPIARHGIGVTGVDLSGPMLADFRSTLAREPGAVRDRVHLIRGDMRRVRLSQTFPLVLCTFNTILHLYTRRDIERFFDHVKAHLAPGGTFVCDLSMPMPEDLTRTFDQPMKTPSFAHPSLGRVKYQERFEYDVTRQILFVSMEFSSKKGDLVTPLAHRQYFPQEFEAFLHYNGFRVARCHGDFSGGPMNRQSETMIFHAKVR